MKKCIPILLIIAFLALVLQAVVNVFIISKEASYVLKTNDNQYTITEQLEIVDNISFYDFTIIDNNDSFYTFSFSEDFNKQSHVISDIKYFKSGDVSCIFPIYKRDKFGDVSCLYNGQQVSYSYLKQINDSNISKITSKLKKTYNNNSWDRVVPQKSTLSDDGKSISIFQENILKDYTFLIWRYKGLYLLKHNKSIIKDYLDYDQYDNSLAALVGKYYIVAASKSSYSRISELVYYNTKEMGKGTIPLLETTSSEFYFNGVYDNKLYMTDVGNLKQFSIDPAFEKVEEVGNKEIGFVTVEKNKLKKVAASDFLSKNVYFHEYISNRNIMEKYGDNTEIIKERKFYYFRTKDGGVYRAHENNINKPVLLFKFDNLTDWKVKNGDILAVAGDTVYFYNDMEGLLPIAVNSELKYNYKNICDFWKK